MSYHGKISPSTLKNPHKYLGNINDIGYRSLWERQLCIWADTNPAVVKWNIEEVVIKYYNPVKDRPAKYIIDFYLEFNDGRQWLVEIKPHKETQQPVLKEGKRATKSFKNKVDTYVVNQEKWRIADHYAKNRGMEFYVFTEFTLDKLGIRRLGPVKDLPLNERKVLASEYGSYKAKKAPPADIKKPTRPKSAVTRKKKPEKE